MSVNILGYHKKHRITATTGLPVLHAWVRSHEESGRRAYLTLGWDKEHRHHRHAWYDRRTGALEIVPDGPHNDSCYRLFPAEMEGPNPKLVLAKLLQVLDGG